MIKLYKVEMVENKVTAMGVQYAMDLFLNTNRDQGPYLNYIFDIDGHFLGVEADKSMQSHIVNFLENIGVRLNEVNFREEHS